MSNYPPISVIAPAFNASSFYPAWLASIQAQRYPNLEVLLVDDGSTDNLREAIQNAPPFLRHIRQENKGPAAARNTGIAAASGELIAFLDMDDLWAPDHLLRSSTALAAHEDYQIVQGLIRNFCYEGDDRAYYCSRAYRFINLGSAVFRRRVFTACGGFEETMRFAEDFDFIIRCWEQGMRKLDIGELSLLYQQHSANMTRGKSVVEMGGVAIYKRRIDRLRAGKARLALQPPHAVPYHAYIGRNLWPLDEGIREPV